MKVKTSELIDIALDWAVAKCEEVDWWAAENPRDGLFLDYVRTQPFSPSTSWQEGGPIIEREGINLDNYGKNPRWSAWTPAPDRESGEAQAYGPTPLIAAMRCYCCSKLGDEIDIPEELCQQQKS